MISIRPIAASLALFTALSLPIATAKAAELPGGYTCQDLRTKVAEYGAMLILASARSRGPANSSGWSKNARCSALLRPLRARRCELSNYNFCSGDIGGWEWVGGTGVTGGTGHEQM